MTLILLPSDLTLKRMHKQLDQFRRALLQTGVGSSDFDLNPDTVLPAGRKLRPAGVLAPIVESDHGLSLLLTKRSAALKHHPGQISFPGGKQDEGDADVIAAALREADEEIGLRLENVEVLGTLPRHETVTGFDVTPVIGFVKAPFDIRPEPGEVDEVFSVPLDHVLNPDNYLIQSRRWRGQMRHYFVVPYGPYYIWGATARMLRAWTEIIQK
jgi:8-oxo-dGTP pyrophosphatase MutT (NUDIX family)